GLGGQAGPQALTPGDPAGGLAVPDHVVGRPQRRRVAHRQLLLAVAELRVVLLHHHALRLQGPDQLHRVVVGGAEAAGRRARALVDRGQPVRPGPPPPPARPAPRGSRPTTRPPP